MLQEALQLNIKSFNLVREITDQDLFAKVELKPVCRLIIFNLANMYNPKLGYTFPGIDKLSRCTGYTERQIKTGLKELFEQGLIVRTDKKIYFTRKFYGLLQLIQEENNSGMSEEISLKGEKSSSSCHEQIKQQDKKQNVLSFQLTEFQKQYQDVFSNLSEYELKKYNGLKGYEKEDWLKARRKEIFQIKSSEKLKQNLKNLNIGSPLDLPLESALEVLKNLPPNSFFAREIRKKWDIKSEKLSC